MTRAVGVSLQQLQQLPDRPIVRNRIRDRHNRLEPERALDIALHDRAAVRPGPLRILHVVEALAVRLPDVDLDALDRLARGVLDGAEDQAGLAGGVVADGSAVALVLGFVCVEGAEYRAFGAGGWLWVVDAVD